MKNWKLFAERDIDKQLLESCKNNDFEKVEELLKDGANSNIIASSHREYKDIFDEDFYFYRATPLHLSIYNENFKIFRLLLEYKADLYSKEYRGISPFKFALKLRSVKIIKFFLLNNYIQHKNEYIVNDLFNWACVKYKYSIIDILLKKGAKFGFWNESDIAHLVISTAYGKEEIDTFKFLILKHAELHYYRFWKKHLQRKLPKELLSVINFYADDWLNDIITEETFDAERYIDLERQDEYDCKNKGHREPDLDLLTILNLYKKNPLNILILKHQFFE